MIAACSGGSDSLALLLLLKHHLDGAAPHARIVAVTVDHGLRPDSAAEALAAGEAAKRFGVDHRILRWEGDKPATGLMAKARLARYRLLAEAAETAGARLILAGHTADDQAETIAMRAARAGSGPGLAGMAPLGLLCGRVWLARPLLGMGRENLRDTLRARGFGWLDDPSNENPRFERVRVRQSLSPAEKAAWLRLGATAAAERTALGRQAAELIAGAAERLGPDAVRLGPGFLDPTRDQAALWACRLVLACLGGRTHLPDAGRTAALLAELGTQGMRKTLSGVTAERRGDAVLLHRERRGGREPPALLPLAPFAAFLPGFDLAPARALAKLFGAPQTPAPPCRNDGAGHP